MKKTFLMMAVTGIFSLSAADLYVDYNQGKSRNSGTKDAPLATFSQAVKKASAGDTIYILPSDKPIRDNIRVHNKSGEPGKPIIVDGMNNIFLGTQPLKSSQWQESSPGYFVYKIKTGANMAGRLFLTFNGKINRMGRVLKGAGGKKFKKVEDLQPGEWTVVDKGLVPDGKGPHKPHFYEYVVRLPEGAKNLADAKIEMPLIRKASGVQISGKSSHWVFRNMIVKNFHNDGYNIHGKCVDLLFENIAAVDCGDDGISAHEACEITVKNMVAIGNSTAACHIQETDCKHENIYAEKITGRELFFTANSKNTFKNVYMYVDSNSGCEWRNKDGESQKCSIDNLVAISNNPKADFKVKGNGEIDFSMKNSKMYGFRRVINADAAEVTKDAAELKNEIEAAKKQLFALFGGNLEKALGE